MFDIAMKMLEQLVGFIPGVFALYLVFDCLGSLLFSRR